MPKSPSRPRFACIPDSILVEWSPRLGAAVMHTLTALVATCNLHGEANAPIDAVAARAGVSRSQAYRNLARLEVAGLITRISSGAYEVPCASYAYRNGHLHPDQPAAGESHQCDKQPVAESRQCDSESHTHDSASRTDTTPRFLLHEIPVPEETPVRTCAGPCVDALWQAFLAVYPKRNGDRCMKKGRDRYLALLKAGADAAAIQAGVERYAAWAAATGKTATEYVKQIPTFLNGRAWEEEWAIPPAANGSPSPNAPATAQANGEKQPPRPSAIGWRGRGLPPGMTIKEFSDELVAETLRARAARGGRGLFDTTIKEDRHA